MKLIQSVKIIFGVEADIFRLPRKDGSNITIYGLGDDVHRNLRPTIVLLHGSGANSVFPQTAGITSVPLLFDVLCEICDEWNVYFVEKRGICFGQCEPEGGAKNAGIDYLKGASYEERVADVCCVLDNLLGDRTQPSCPVVLIGSSEGSDIALGVAAKHCGPTHVALLPFSGGNGLYGALTELRSELSQGVITAEEFKAQYDELVSTFRDILGGSKNSIEKYFWGHTYRRWSSHCSGAVMEDLLEIDIPVFLGIPSLGKCEGIDLVVAEFVKHGKTNLMYQNYINYDHGFFEHKGDRVVCRHSQVLTDILQWVQVNEKAEHDPAQN